MADFRDTPDATELLLRWAPIPNTPQEGLFNDLTPEGTLLFLGGYGSGKTTTLVAKMLQLSAINAPLPGIITVPDFGHFEDTILATLTDLDPETMQPWFLDTSQFGYRGRDHMFEWIGGGPIHVQSARYPESIKGPQRAFGLMDEPGIVAYEAYRATVNRIRHPRAKLRQFVASGTPEGLNWLADLVEREKTGGGRPVHLYRMHTQDNRELLKWQPTYIQQVLENSTEAEARAYLGGEMVNLAGAMAYPQFSRDTHWRYDVRPNPALPLRFSWDFNVDPLAMVVGQISVGPHGRELAIIDAVVQSSHALTMDVAQTLVRRYGVQACAEAGYGGRGWPGGCLIYGDTTGNSRSTLAHQSNYDQIEEILRPQFPCGFARHPSLTGANPFEEDRVLAVNVLFRDATGRVRCYIKRTDPALSCPTHPLVRSLELSLKAPGTTRLFKGGRDTVTHAADALGYLIAAEFPALRPQSITPATHFASTDW